jgi:hypothetical protein
MIIDTEQTKLVTIKTLISLSSIENTIVEYKD